MAWLREQDPKTTYWYPCAASCLGRTYLRAKGIGENNDHYCKLFEPDATGDLPSVNIRSRILNTDDRDDRYLPADKWTYGKALARAEAMLELLDEHALAHA